jgi:hypothetical protein
MIGVGKTGKAAKRNILTPLVSAVSEELVILIRNLESTGGVAQVVECLLWKHKALSSNATTSREIKKKNQSKSEERTELRVGFGILRC